MSDGFDRTKGISLAVAVALSLCLITAAGTTHSGPRFTESRDGARIAYYGAGQGPTRVPLLVIAGGPGSDRRYMNAGGAIDALAKGRTVITYDQRGTGKSARVPGSPTIDLWLEDIDAIRMAVGAERLDLLGHSFGGYLAMSYSDAYASHVRSLVLVDSAAPNIDDNIQLLSRVYPDRLSEWRSVRSNLPDEFKAPDIAVFFSMEFVDPSWLDRYLEHVDGFTYNIAVNNELRGDMAARDLGSRIGNIDNPVMVMHGRYDAVLATENSWRMHEALPNSEFEVIEMSGHMPFVERADEFVRVVEEFLSKVDAADGVYAE